MQKQIDIDFVTIGNSISRARRRLNQFGKSLPTDPEVIRKRRIKEEYCRELYTPTKKENHEHAISTCF